ncbi:MAG: hypothetical protein KQ78_01477 [Candidatus Izimaplasma bacterium HR2]|nr:MAG: hypothetical protein KQ78_01477 [Candidatus Izimaplasma bacterium HR2]
MENVYKYGLNLTDFQEIELPEGAEILCVDTLKNNNCTIKEQLYLWAKVNPDAILVPRRICIFGTGQTMKYEHKLKYIGTVKMFNEKLIWHVFENYI